MPVQIYWPPFHVTWALVTKRKDSLLPSSSVAPLVEAPTLRCLLTASLHQPTILSASTLSNSFWWIPLMFMTCLAQIRHWGCTAGVTSDLRRFLNNLCEHRSDHIAPAFPHCPKQRLPTRDPDSEWPWCAWKTVWINHIVNSDVSSWLRYSK